MEATKEKLIFEIKQLPNKHIAELHNFVRYLKFKQSGKAASSAKPVSTIEEDPILQAIGMMDTAPFSEAIDDILYGDQ